MILIPVMTYGADAGAMLAGLAVLPALCTSARKWFREHREARRARMSLQRSTVPAVDSQSCEPGCMRHREHVYILCYGEPTVIREGDCGDRPVTHYVGYTQQQPPVRRVWQHGRGSARALALVRPGTLRDEARAKCLETCPRCGGRLWYLGGKWPAAGVLAEGGLFIAPRDNRVRRGPRLARPLPPWDGLRGAESPAHRITPGAVR